MTPPNCLFLGSEEQFPIGQRVTLRKWETLNLRTVLPALDASPEGL
jgi:hypothetical protein